MKPSLMKIALVALVGMSTVFQHQAAVADEGNVNADAALEALMAADAAWSETVGDTDVFLSHFTDDALFMPADAPLAQGDAIRATWEQLTSNPGFSLNWVATHAELAESGELGYTAGSFKLTLDHEGVLMETIGKFLTVWNRQEDGSWKVRVDCFNADGPPTPAGDS